MSLLLTGDKLPVMLRTHYTPLDKIMTRFPNVSIALNVIGLIAIGIAGALAQLFRRG